MPNINQKKSKIQASNIPKKLRNRIFLPGRYLVPILCALVIIVRIIWKDMRFDQTSLWLFIVAAIVLIIPDIGDLLSRIKKVKKGDIEIEFESRIANLAMNTEKIEESTLETSEDEYLADYGSIELRNKILELTRDPRAGLVSLAVEIEAALSRLSAQYKLRGKGKRISPRFLVEELSRRKILPQELPLLFNDFWAIRNQAVHSVSFQPTNQNLYEILDLGIRILRLIYMTQNPEDKPEA